MKKTKTFSVISVLFIMPLIYCAQQAPKIVLESALLKLADGTFFDANKIEQIRGFQYKINTLLLGERTTNGERVGLYTFEKKKYSLYKLLKIEHEVDNVIIEQSNNIPKKYRTMRQELNSILEQAKKDFLGYSNAFRGQARGAKSLTVALIEESCTKRNRLDSILMLWADTDNTKEENLIFEQKVPTIKFFVSFLVDLSHFLTDLTNSCPKALEQFRQRVATFNVVKKLFSHALKKINLPCNEAAFFIHLKEKHLDNLISKNITTKTVQDLIMQFVTKKIIEDDEQH